MPEQVIALPYGPLTGFPASSVIMFHVEHQPVQEPSSKTGSAGYQVESAWLNHRNRHQPRKFGNAAQLQSIFMQRCLLPANYPFNSQPVPSRRFSHTTKQRKSIISFLNHSIMLRGSE